MTKGVKGQMGFVHLHVHSEYSLLKSVCTIKDYVKTGKARGCRVMAITDINVVYGVIPFYKECLNEKIKPLIGMEVTMVETDEWTKQKQSYPLLLFAKNNEGYQELLQLATLTQTNDTQNPGLEKEILWKIGKNLIVIFSYEKGLLYPYASKQLFKDAKALIAPFVDHLGEENVYIELQMHRKEDKKIVHDLYLFAKENDLQVVASNHVHFLDKEDHLAFEVVNAIEQGEKLTEKNGRTTHTNQYYFKTEEDMISLFSNFPEAIANTEKIAEQCNVSIPMGSMYLPKYPVPNDVAADDYLKQICYEGLSKRYEVISPEIEERLAFELDVIAKMKFSDYFLIVWDFMKYAHEKKIIVGPGRGSAAGSLVAYVLRITNVDPIKYDLLFERFLNPERITMPDIDIDFPDDRREEVIHYVVDKYGKERVAQIITFGTLAAKAAIRDVGRVLAIDTALINKIAHLIANANGKHLKEKVANLLPLKQMYEQNKEAMRLIDIASKIEGLPRHTSTHAAGIVISSNKLTETVALQKGQGDVALTQFPMEVLEELGHLKMDFLGLRNLSLLETIVQLIATTYKKKIELHSIDLTDHTTFELLGKGETTGVFQLESQGMRKVLQQLKPTEFEDIVAVNALYRPGPMEYIPSYIQGKQRLRSVTYPHPTLEPILKKTYGVIVYQEQIMQIAAKMAGFTLGEADLLRRAVSKKQKAILEEERNHFVEGSRARGYSADVANKVYDMILRFANYGFNRSHAVAYSLVAYQLAYLKANYPAAFYCALLSSVSYHQEKLSQYIVEAKKNSIDIFLPSINSSQLDFSIEGKGIRFGLSSIRQVGWKAAQEIIEQRNNKRYEDIFDFCSRVDMRLVPKRTMEALIITGCFDETPHHRAQLLATLDEAIEYGQEKKRVTEQNGKLFTLHTEKPLCYDIPPFEKMEKLTFERELMGFFLSGHPIEEYKERLKQYGRIDSASLGRIEAGQTVFLAGMIEEVKLIKTKKKEEMAFLTVSDEKGLWESVLFPKELMAVKYLLKQHSLVFIKALLKKGEKGKSIIIQSVQLVKDIVCESKAKTKEKIFLRIVETLEEREHLEKLKKILLTYPGPMEVYLFYEREKKTVKLDQTYNLSNTEVCIKQLQLMLGVKNVVIKRDLIV